MPEPIFSISEINEYVRMVLDADVRLRHVWLRGEISNFVNHYKTGHFYFSLKDEVSSLRAVMFRGNNSKLTFVPENGMRVLAHGEIRAYPRDGQTQIIVDELQPDGAGALALAFEQTRRRLEAEGLFDAARKRSLPLYPRRIGVVTSPSGAAVHDIIRITARRYPSAELIIFPAQVQGAGAAESLAMGIEFFSAVDLCDVIIIGRGGGSMEDLWAFNDEGLARSIAACRLPVISAVGHESDVTICDFVADVRAPTPSGAAELVVPDRNEIGAQLAEMEKRLHCAVENRIRSAREALRMRQSNRILLSPGGLFDERRMHLCLREERLARAIERLIEQKRAMLEHRTARVCALSPLSAFSRGYIVASDENSGKMVTRAASLSPGQVIRLRFADGEVLADVRTIEVNEIAKEKKDGYN